jgi:maleylpyruvate isomerase
MLKLHTYFRSSAAYRVRIALNLKGLEYESIPVHLLRDGGEHLKDSYRQLNPAGLVPTLVDGDTVLTQSLAIIEYLEERYPQHPLLPADAAGRARVRALALDIACEIHPVNNLRVLKYLKNTLGVSDEAKNEWYRHWVVQGLQAFEAQLVRSGASGRFCHGDTPTLADVCLVPQIFNARRFDVDLAPYPTTMTICGRCEELPAFADAHPARQPDAE